MRVARPQHIIGTQQTFLLQCKMATPRKFQEKIALLQQKEAEGKMEYDQIMNEVHELTKGVCVKVIAIPGGVIIRS